MFISQNVFLYLNDVFFYKLICMDCNHVLTCGYDLIPEVDRGHRNNRKGFRKFCPICTLFQQFLLLPKEHLEVILRNFDQTLIESSYHSNILHIFYCSQYHSC